MHLQMRTEVAQCVEAEITLDAFERLSSLVQVGAP